MSFLFHDHKLLDFSKTGEDIIVYKNTVQVLEPDEETYNADNPFIVCSDATRNKPIDLTGANFVRVYDNTTKNIRTLISVKDEDEYIDGNDKTYTCYRLTDNFFFDINNCVVLSDLQPVSSVYSIELYTHHGIKLRKDKVLYLRLEFPDDHNEPVREILLQHTTLSDILARHNIEYYHNEGAEVFNIITGESLTKEVDLSLAGKVTYEEIEKALKARNHDMRNPHWYCNRDIESYALANAYMAAIKNAIANNDVYDIDSDFVKACCERNSNFSHYNAIKAAITDQGFIIENERCSPHTVHWGHISTAMYYHFDIKTKHGNKIGHIYTDLKHTIQPSSNMELTLLTGSGAGFKTITLPFTNKEINALGLRHHWDSTLSISFCTSSEHNNAVEMIRSIFGAIKRASITTKRKVDFNLMTNNISDKSPYNVLARFGNDIGLITLKDGYGYFESDAFDIKADFNRSSTSLCAFLTLFSLLKKDELYKCVEDYANKHYKQINRTNRKGNPYAVSNVAKQIVDAYLQQNQLLPDDITILNGTISTIIRTDTHPYRLAVCNTNDIRAFNESGMPEMIMDIDGNTRKLTDYDRIIINVLKDIPSHDKMYIIGETEKCSYRKIVHSIGRTLKSHVSNLFSIYDTQKNKLGKLTLKGVYHEEIKGYKVSEYNLEDNHYRTYKLVISRKINTSITRVTFVNHSAAILSDSVLNYNDYDNVSMNIERTTIPLNELWALTDRLYDAYQHLYKISHPEK